MLPREARLVGSGSPFELVDIVLNGLTYRTYRHGPKTLNDIYRRAARSPAREFLVHNERRFSNTTILSQGIALGRILSESFNISTGTRVGLLLGTRPEWLVAFMAVTSIGATAVALPGQIDPTEISAALELTNCLLVIADNATASWLSDSGYRGASICLGDGSDCRSTLAFTFPLDASDDTGPDVHFPAIDAEQLALIAFTSGSTGRSKGVMINHRSLVHGIMNMLLGAALSAGTPRKQPSVLGAAQVSLLTAPFSHISGYSHLLLMLFLGGKVVSLPEWDPSIALTLIQREAVTSLAGATPARLRDLISNNGAVEALGSLRSIGIHGVALAPSILFDLAAALPHVIVSTGYGMTETNGAICAISDSQLAERPTSSGRPLPTVDLRIEPTDNAPADGEVGGEILVRGAMLMQGYCGHSIDRSAAITKEWFQTGDLGFVDADGFMHVTDRAAHVVVCNGRRISCGVVEKALLDCGLVKDIAVFGGPDFYHGDRLVVIAVPDGRKNHDEETLLKSITDLTQVQALDPRIIWVTELPHMSNGKIDRLQLRQRLLTQWAAQ
jgi:acyl-CoA synthetase (AMP-forming)/AMP-acid ligase II